MTSVRLVRAHQTHLEVYTGTWQCRSHSAPSLCASKVMQLVGRCSEPFCCILCKIMAPPGRYKDVVCRDQLISSCGASGLTRSAS